MIRPGRQMSPAVRESGGTRSNQEGTDSIRPSLALHSNKCIYIQMITFFHWSLVLWAMQCIEHFSVANEFSSALLVGTSMLVHCTFVWEMALCNCWDGRYPLPIYQMTGNRLQRRLASNRLIMIKCCFRILYSLIGLVFLFFPHIVCVWVYLCVCLCVWVYLSVFVCVFEWCVCLCVCVCVQRAAVWAVKG